METKGTNLIKARHWYEYILWAVWLFALVFMAQNAMASSAELEPRAATIFWMIFAVVLIGGGVVWFVRRGK